MFQEFFKSATSVLYMTPEEPPRHFIDTDISTCMCWRKTPLDRMKLIDSIRLHVPTDQERSNLKIPHHIHRVDMMDLSKVLMMCGGHNGVKFTDEEMSSIILLVKDLNGFIWQLETHFHSMAHDVVNSSLDGELLDDRGLLSEAINLSERDLLVLSFHMKADTIFRLLSNLQSTIRNKYQEQLCQASRRHTSGSRALLTRQCDPALPNTNMIEPWLEVLLNKFRREYMNVQMLEHDTNVLRSVVKEAQHQQIQCRQRKLHQKKYGWRGMSNRKYSQDNENASYAIDSSQSDSMQFRYLQVKEESEDSYKELKRIGVKLGLFCAFLSCCLCCGIPCSNTEQRALFQLIYLSRDEKAMRSGSLSVDSISQDYVFSYTQKYWANRLFEFLRDTAMREFACVAEESLFNFNSILSVCL
mmetsp:Transcript_24946/g.36794  ORF Transcript_24946/g.36794 Transcript_24946/m.36794 type:complete len:414 (+) Transcript_24946:106-1347(+)